MNFIKEFVVDLECWEWLFLLLGVMVISGGVGIFIIFWGGWIGVFRVVLLRLLGLFIFMSFVVLVVVDIVGMLIRGFKIFCLRLNGCI